MNLGYIGLGNMGGALARRMLLSAPLRVFDLNPDAVRRLTDLGAQPSQSPAAMAQECDIIMTCLPTSDHLRDAIFGAGGMLEGLTPGKLVVDQTTGDPNETRAMAAELKERGIDLIDAPVSGGPKGADAGTIAIMVGAPQGLFDRIRPHLETVSPNIFHCGAVGAGQTMKLVNNVVSACNRIATFEAVAMGAKNGLDLKKMVEVLSAGSGQSKAVTISLPRMLSGTLGDFALDLMLKDVRLACQLGRASGAPMTAANLTHEIMRSAANMLGDGSVSVDRVIDLIERNADVKMFK
ncbi:MAG: NAD(P)-dependent oxidoreductase [Rhodospirillaceae bacterium]